MGGEEIFLGMQEYMKSKEEIREKSLNVELQRLYISAQSTATFIVQMKQNLSQFTFEKDTIIK